MLSSRETTITVSIVMPALNEESGIKRTIHSIPKSKIYEQGYHLEVLVVDGNSTDLTRDNASELGAKVIVEKQKGYGRALKTGMNAAKGDIIVTLDADGSYPAELIPLCLETLDKNDLDFISVNRFSKMEKGAMSIVHGIGNKIFSASMRMLYSINVKDSSSGMWIMRKRTFVDKIQLKSDGMTMTHEVKIIAFRFFKSLEVDGTYYKRIGTKKLSTFRDGWNMLNFLFRYKKLLRFALQQQAATKGKSSVSY